MIRYPPPTPWRTPFHWWGPPWAEADPVHLAAQIDRGVVTRTEADRLRGILLTSQPLIIAAAQSRSGKSSLLWSLVTSLPASTERIHIRGNAEPFDFVDFPHTGPRLMLVNELSHYLPTYCWGETANRVLQLTPRGFGLAATMHAADAASVATDLLAGSLISEGEHLPAITVAILGRRRANDEVNGVIEIESVSLRSLSRGTSAIPTGVL